MHWLARLLPDPNANGGRRWPWERPPHPAEGRLAQAEAEAHSLMRQAAAVERQARREVLTWERLYRGGER